MQHMSIVKPCFRDYGTLRLAESHKWYDEFSRLIEWYLYTESIGWEPMPDNASPK